MNLTTEIMAMDKLKTEPWNGAQGPTWFVQGSFKDGSLFSRGAKSLENAQKLQAELEAQIGKEATFEVEDTGKEYQGRKKWKLQGWPGKPERPAFGGGSKAPYQPRFRDTEDGFHQEQASIHRSVALDKAITFTTNHVVPDDISPKKVLAVAEEFYGWLVGPQRAAPASPAQVQAQAKQASSMVQKASSLFGDEPEQAPVPAAPQPGYQVCPQCGKTEFVRKSKLDGTPPWYCYKKIGGCGHQWGDFPKQLPPLPDIQEKSCAVLASEQIDAAVKKKDQAYLSKVAGAITQRHKEGLISDEEVLELNIEVGVAGKAITSGLNHEDWYREKLRAVQEREQELSPDMQEMVDRF